MDAERWQKWRDAICRHAKERNKSIGPVAREFGSLVHGDPPDITTDEAKELAKLYPFTPSAIRKAFIGLSGLDGT